MGTSMENDKWKPSDQWQEKCDDCGRVFYGLSEANAKRQLKAHRRTTCTEIDRAIDPFEGSKELHSEEPKEESKVEVKIEQVAEDTTAVITSTSKEPPREIELPIGSLRKVLETIGYTQPQFTHLDQMKAFLDAFEIFAEKNARYEDGWKDAGWYGNLVEMRKKLDRLWKEYGVAATTVGDEPPLEALDSAYDLLNITVFFIRNVLAKNAAGTWPWT